MVSGQDVSWDEFKEDYETLSLANPKKEKTLRR